MVVTTTIEFTDTKIKDQNSMTSTSSMVMPDELEDYTKSRGYIVALGMYSLLLIIILSIVCVCFKIKRRFFAWVATISFILFLFFTSFSIHYNKVEMDQKDKNGIKQIDKYYNKNVNKMYIDAGWIFPTVFYAAIPTIGLVACIVLLVNIIIKRKKAATYKLKKH